MKTTFDWTGVSGYIIADLDGRQCLIDTGTPTSVGNKPFTLFGHIIPTVESIGLDCQQLSENIGCRVDFLLGLDLLARWPWTIDWPNRALTFHIEPGPEFEGLPVPLKRHHIEIRRSEFAAVQWLEIDFRLDGYSRQALFDTGCPIGGYLPQGEISGTPVFREFRDFLPGYGWFKTDLYRRRVDIGSTEFKLDFGITPSNLGYLNIPILGNPIFHGGLTSIDVQGGTLYLPRMEASCN